MPELKAGDHIYQYQQKGVNRELTRKRVAFVTTHARTADGKTYNRFVGTS